MAPQPDLHWRPILKRRLIVAAAVFALWAAGIEARLVVLQVVQHDDLVARADQQQMRTVASPAKRGEIFDRRGRMLAYSVDADTIWASPGDVKNPEQTVAALCAALDDCDRKFRTQLTERLGRQRGFVYVKRRAAPLEAKRVAALGLEGIRFMKESKRFYPNRELAANVLGYVGLDNVGLHGVEAAFDKVVRGRPGTLLIQTDARSQGFSRLERSPTIGSAIELTLDEQLQYIVERELKAGVAENNAEGGSAVIMDPHNGEILAMATWPTFNPNSYNESDTEARRNRAVQDLYEPGSTFKIVTASAAFEEHVVTPDEMIDASGGSIKFPGRKPINDTHDYGVLSFTDVIVKSSNVGAIKVGLKLGPERLGLYINRFGFGRQTSIDFPGENPGIVWNPARLNDSALASVSMGYQVGVTPIQMAAAVSSVANGGTLYEPRILRTVIRGGMRTPVTPKAVRRTIKPETAATLTAIMEQVVERGTAKAAQMPGFTVAGKTGTAAKLINGRYSTTNYNASFVGFVPSRDPALTIIVVIDSPHTKGHTGGAAAAPVFQRIANASLRYLGVGPTVGAPPPVMVARRAEGPVSAAASPVDPTPVVTLAGSSDPPMVPDLRGLGAREAMRSLARAGLTARIFGAGVVIDQQPLPGTTLDPGTICTLVLSRQGPGQRLPGAQP
ncbi:MAG: penicillin-binding protein [Vicinamibacterales bacterium]